MQCDNYGKVGPCNHNAEYLAIWGRAIKNQFVNNLCPECLSALKHDCAPSEGFSLIIEMIKEKVIFT